VDDAVDAGNRRAVLCRPHDTAQNIDAGTRYSWLMEPLPDSTIRFPRDRAAYNAGPGNVIVIAAFPSPFRDPQVREAGDASMKGFSRVLKKHNPPEVDRARLRWLSKGGAKRETPRSSTRPDHVITAHCTGISRKARSLPVSSCLPAAGCPHTPRIHPHQTQASPARKPTNSRHLPRPGTRPVRSALRQHHQRGRTRHQSTLTQTPHASRLPIVIPPSGTCTVGKFML